MTEGHHLPPWNQQQAMKNITFERVTSLYHSKKCWKTRTLFYDTQRFHICSANQSFTMQRAKLNVQNKSFFAMAVKKPNTKRLKG